MKLLKTETSASHCAYTIVEVMVSIFVIAIMMISLYGGFSAGFSVVKVSRENLRATPIMVQKMETIRLLNWSEIFNPKTYVQSPFTDDYHPACANANTPCVFYSRPVS